MLSSSSFVLYQRSQRFYLLYCRNCLRLALSARREIDTIHNPLDATRRQIDLTRFEPASAQSFKTTILIKADGDESAMKVGRTETNFFRSYTFSTLANNRLSRCVSKTFPTASLMPFPHYLLPMELEREQDDRAKLRTKN